MNDTPNRTPLTADVERHLLDSVGVALGWGHLVDRFLGSGQLVRPLGSAQVRTEFGYYLLTPQNHPAFPSRSEVSDWLVAVSAARIRYAD